jgi:hypothetical protein
MFTRRRRPDADDFAKPAKCCESKWRPMAHSETLQENSVEAGDGQTPPPWLAAYVTEFRLIRRALNVVRPIRAIAFGGMLVFVTLLAFLLRHSPDGQSVLLAASLFGLPICLAVWFIASSAQRRLNRTKHRIEHRVYSAGMHVDDQGRVLTDNPHSVLILDPASRSAPNMS